MHKQRILLGLIALTTSPLAAMDKPLIKSYTETLSQEKMLATVEQLSRMHGSLTTPLKSCHITTGLEQDETNTTFLHWACLSGSLPLVQHLLSIGDNRQQAPRIRNNEKETLLHFACTGNNEEVVTYLLSEGIFTGNEENDFNETPLIVSAKEGNACIVELLLSQEVLIDHEDHQGAAALHWACHEGHFPVVRLLVEAKADVNKLSTIEGTPLHSACLNGSNTIVIHLLDNGAKVNVTNQDEVTPLHNACFGGYLSLVKLLLAQGACIDAQTVTDDTPLITACSNEHTQVARYLISQGANADIKDDEGYKATAYTDNTALQKLFKQSGDKTAEAFIESAALAKKRQRKNSPKQPERQAPPVKQKTRIVAVKNMPEQYRQRLANRLVAVKSTPEQYRAQFARKKAKKADKKPQEPRHQIKPVELPTKRPGQLANKPHKPASKPAKPSRKRATRDTGIQPTQKNKPQAYPVRQTTKKNTGTKRAKPKRKRARKKPQEPSPQMKPVELPKSKVDRDLVIEEETLPTPVSAINNEVGTLLLLNFFKNVQKP